MKLIADVDQPENKSDDYFRTFDVVVATCCTNQQLVGGTEALTEWL